MSLCDKSITDIIERYMKRGWSELSDIFLDKSGKEKQLKENVNEYLLKMLGSIRVYYIDMLFKCYNTEDTATYFSFGSSEVTSDYDLTIIGINAADITWKIFIHFFRKYKKSLPYVFDSNLYCSGYLYNKNLICNKYSQKVNDKISIIKPVSVSEYKLCQNFALIKLLNYTEYMGENMRKYTNTASELKKGLDNELDKNIFSSSHDVSTRNLINRYYLTCMYGKRLEKVFYKKEKKNDIISNYCKSSYFSIESYYTPCTVNVVVIEMQSGIKVNLDKNDYIVSAIENLGDLMNHIKNIDDVSDQTLLKTSKYFYRIFYSLGKTGQGQFLERAQKIKDNIIPLRGKQIKGDIDFYPMIEKNQTVKDTIQGLFSVLDDLLL
jgi:hypothetical protein